MYLGIKVLVLLQYIGVKKECPHCVDAFRSEDDQMRSIEEDWPSWASWDFLRFRECIKRYIILKKKKCCLIHPTLIVIIMMH